MAITAKRTSVDLAVTGATQSITTGSIMGRIDQLIIYSTVQHSFDLSLTNMYGEVFYEKGGIYVGTGETLSDMNPQRLPMGTVTITISNPVPESGTVTFTFIEKERES